MSGLLLPITAGRFRSVGTGMPDVMCAESFVTLVARQSAGYRVMKRLLVESFTVDPPTVAFNANSRMKDFYDVWICSNHLAFNAKTLLKAIDATFKNRQTPEEFEALSPGFIRAHRIQWNAFVNKMCEGQLADSSGKVVADLREFAMPALRALKSNEKFTRNWKAGTGWV